MTEAFTTFFINHGLTKALRKAFLKRGWTTDQMQELMTNFQHKHGKKIPLPKIYADEDSSDSEGLELQDGTCYGRKTPGGSGGKPGRKLLTGGGGGGTGSKPGTSQGGGSVGGGGGTGGRQPGKRGQDNDGDDDDPNERRKTDPGNKQSPPQIARKEPCKLGTQYPPVNRNLPVLYISHQKEKTDLGFRMLDWIPAQLQKIHQVKMQGRLVKSHRYRVGMTALRDIRHTNLCAIHAKWVTIMPSDIQLARHIREREREHSSPKPNISVLFRTTPNTPKGVTLEKLKRLVGSLTD